MPDISGPELLFVLTIVVLFFSIGKLPQIARDLGGAIRKIRREPGVEENTPSQQPLHEVAEAPILKRGDGVGVEVDSSEQELALGYEDPSAQLTELQQEQRTDQARSRYIPKEVASKLLEDMRCRCCICRVMIDPQRFDVEAQFGSLDKHHIIYFSEGGGNTYDNLLLVCANCHRDIHSHPEKYPTDKLPERKRHWAGMKEHVPSKLEMTDGTDDVIRVTFSVESVNLQYSILASSQATASQLALFVRDKVLKPLGEYDNNDNWLHPGKVELVLRSAPEKPLDSGLSLKEIQLTPDDPLVAIISARVVPVVVPPWDFSRHLREEGLEEPTLEEAPLPFEPEMILIPAGKFLMGSDPKKDKYARDDEQPQHTLYLPDYYLAKTPVTNIQYAAFVQATGHKQPWHWKGGKPPRGKEDHPVIQVSWHDAMAYCDWLAGVTGRPYGLPSEAEWEKGARGSDGRIYPWGNRWDAERCNAVWAYPPFTLSHEDPRRGGKKDTTAVGAYPQGASPYGLLDMAGNVWEWTRSLWGGSLSELSFKYPYDPADGREDLDAPDSVLRVLRGGSWNYGRVGARCVVRLGVPPNQSSSYYLGFRLCVV